MRSPSRIVRALLGLLLSTVALGLALTPAPIAAEPVFKGEVIPDRYIVVLKPDVDPQSKADSLVRSRRINLFHVYRSTVRGFAATLPSGLVNLLKLDPDVTAIVEDRTVAAFADTVPTGLRRTQANRNPLARIGSGANPVDVDVAVIDTGIDLDHPDLEVMGGVSCVPGDPSYDDANGHGTHVAGTVGALDNGEGVVGMAPGARLWAVRVLNAAGEGAFSDVMCGIEWVTEHADTIEVANMSLGATGEVGSCDDGGLHQSVCESVAAGVTYVVAAGNDGANAGGYVPAAYDEVITVSAMVDTDGQPGSKGPYIFFYGRDDSLATFSNWGPVVDLAAPGVNIRSTWIGGSYANTSGTSMASPHVAGAAALYRFANPDASPSQVKAGLQEIAWDQGSVDGFSGDADGYPEKLLNAGSIGGEPLPPPPPSCATDVDSGPVGTLVKLTCSNLPPSQGVKAYWDSVANAAARSFTASMDGTGWTSLGVPTVPGGLHTIIVQLASGGETTLPFTITPSLKLPSTKGAVGSWVTVYLKGYVAGEAVELRWTGNGADAVVQNVAVGDNGALTTSFTVPESVKGEYMVTGGGQTSQTSASGSYTVMPSLKLSPTSGRVGSTTTVTMRGYGAGETVTILWYDTASASTVITSLKVSELGGGSKPFILPAATKGQHAVKGIGNAGSSASANYSVISGLSLSKTSGAVGDDLTISARGYGASETVTIQWYDTTSSAQTLATVTTDPRGSVDATVSLPEATRGAHKITTRGATSGANNSIYFTVNQRMTLSSTSGPAGSTVDVSLTGFRASEAVSINWYNTATSSTVITTATASAVGSATATFQVPEVAAGSYKVEAVSASNLKSSTTFTVTG